MYHYYINDMYSRNNFNLTLHDALPILPKYFTEKEANGSGISDSSVSRASIDTIISNATTNVSSVLAEYITEGPIIMRDRKSTRLNSSHSQISYAVFCLKKKTNNKKNIQ